MLINLNLKTKTDYNRRSSPSPSHQGSPEGGWESMVCRICQTGGLWVGSERVREWWMTTVVYGEKEAA